MSGFRELEQDHYSIPNVLCFMCSQNLSFLELIYSKPNFPLNFMFISHLSLWYICIYSISFTEL